MIRPVRERQALGLLLMLGLGLMGPQALAGPLITAGPVNPASFTGNVEVDFPSTKVGVITLVNPRYPTQNPEAFIAQHGLSTGWSIKDIRLMYDDVADRLFVGVNFFGIAGDADSNGNPGTVSPQAAAKGAIDLPSLGGRESITVGLDMTKSGRPTILAGVPGDKRQAGPGLNGFSVSAFANVNAGIANSYGLPLSLHQGTLYFDPSPQHPDFIFSINNFSKLPGYDPDNGFGLIAFAGTPDDTFEEEGVLFSDVAFGRIPEPATVLAWSVALVAAAAWRHRSRRHADRSAS
ncbi:MAG: hypothetical protein KatS3mg108_1779 [Isosphaeraceae bacterium]|jgi:hypothetical protein|nr:MAG: hypothetical protein KatS3mg108_1779 [Isosphaeraceae bacterium]